MSIEFSSGKKDTTPSKSAGKLPALLLHFILLCNWLPCKKQEAGKEVRY
jgi:hypothetical protein